MSSYKVEFERQTDVTDYGDFDDCCGKDEIEAHEEVNIDQL